MGCQQSKVKDSKSATTVPYFKQASGVVVPAEDAPIVAAAAAAPVADTMPCRRSLSQQREPLGITVAAKSCSPDRLAATTSTNVRYDMMEQTCCQPEEYQGGFDNTITVRRPSPSPAPAEDEVVVPQVVEQPLPNKSTSRQASQQPVISREESRQLGEPQPREPSRPSAKSSVAREPSAQPAPREVSQQQTSLIMDASQQPQENEKEEEEATTAVPNDSVLVAKSDLMQLALAVAAAEVKEARRRMRREKRRATLASHHAATGTRLSGSSALDDMEGSVRSRKSVAFTREVLEASIPECCQPQKKSLRRSMGRRDKNHTVDLAATPVEDSSEDDMWCDMSFEENDEENAEKNNSAIMNDPTAEVFPRLSGLLEQALRASAERTEGVLPIQPLQQQKVNACSNKKPKGSKKKGDNFVYNANSDTLNTFGKKSRNVRKENVENSGVVRHRRNRPHSHVGKPLHLHSNISEQKYQEMANAFARLLTDIQTFDAQMAS